MDKFLIEIKDKFRNNDDFFLQDEQILDVSVTLVGIRTLVDFTQTKRKIHNYIANAISSKKTIGELLNELGEVKEEDMTEAVSSIMKGKLLIVIKDQHKYVILEPVPKLLSRAIEKPTNENV
ncbi:hypothetical protein CR203_16980 [Salipaludibacillus neizhouensis]|uniref:Uncharacterized protein n=1 Tax=Salipaludibacillus neizhouensis TaxID=885475 RepID=A0A3A9K9C1_9BACI|nr:spore germination protein [Salipaludibacillus neizhouensis]RKL66243.1 hypothetical protein CR203_16980 [Salipaludibacillus neizhouensis]